MKNAPTAVGLAHTGLKMWAAAGARKHCSEAPRRQPPSYDAVAGAASASAQCTTDAWKYAATATDQRVRDWLAMDRMLREWHENTPTTESSARSCRRGLAGPPPAICSVSRMVR